MQRRLGPGLAIGRSTQKFSSRVALPCEVRDGKGMKRPWGGARTCFFMVGEKEEWSEVKTMCFPMVDLYFSCLNPLGKPWLFRKRPQKTRGFDIAIPAEARFVSPPDASMLKDWAARDSELVRYELTIMSHLRGHEWGQVFQILGNFVLSSSYVIGGSRSLKRS